MRVFVVVFMIRKGLGPEEFEKHIDIGIDDVQPEWSEQDMKDMARRDAESILRRSEDYPLYGENFRHIETYNA